MFTREDNNYDPIRMDCTKSFETSFGDESLIVSLLRSSQLSLNETSSSSSHFNNPSFIMSFEDPFQDPNMEPLPIRPNGLNSEPAPPALSMSDSIFNCDDCSMIPSSKLPLNLADILDPVLDLVGSKRSSCDNDMQCQPFAKRLRTSHQGGEESTARFRPYQEKQWRAMFQKLIEYKREKGHCSVPHSYPEDPILARWVKRQRYQYKKFNDGNPTSTMTTRRIEELQAIGFVWHSHASAWQEKLNELTAFQQANGHCNVPSHYPENVPLSTWVKCQRRQYKLYTQGKPSNMTIERFQVLESMGFVFDVRQIGSQKSADFF